MKASLSSGRSAVLFQRSQRSFKHLSNKTPESAQIPPFVCECWGPLTPRRKGSASPPADPGGFRLLLLEKHFEAGTAPLGLKTHGPEHVHRHRDDIDQHLVLHSPVAQRKATVLKWLHRGRAQCPSSSHALGTYPRPPVGYSTARRGTPSAAR